MQKIAQSGHTALIVSKGICSYISICLSLSMFSHFTQPLWHYTYCMYRYLFLHSHLCFCIQVFSCLLLSVTISLFFHTFAYVFSPFLSAIHSRYISMSNASHHRHPLDPFCQSLDSTLQSDWSQALLLSR